MARRIEIAALGVALMGVGVALLAWLWPVPAVTYSGMPNIPVQRVVKHQVAPDSTLRVSGTGAHVVIKAGVSGSWYEGGSVSATNANSVIYLPVGQKLKVTITGTGALVEIDSKLMPYVQVSNLGAGANVVEI